MKEKKASIRSEWVLEYQAATKVTAVPKRDDGPKKKLTVMGEEEF